MVVKKKRKRKKHNKPKLSDEKKKGRKKEKRKKKKHLKTNGVHLKDYGKEFLLTIFKIFGQQHNGGNLL